MEFCIRDDDTSFFTSPDDLERVYGEATKWGPISLAVVPFHRAGLSKGVPDRYRGRGSVHPVHDNPALVEYLRGGVSAGRFEIMLHGFYHDEPRVEPEFAGVTDLVRRVVDGRKYLEDLLGAPIRVFVPPKNTIGREGLRAVTQAGLHLGGTGGLRAGWSRLSGKAWRKWWHLRRWTTSGESGIPWVLDLGDHREIAGHPVTPSSIASVNDAVFDRALAMGGVFCAATHYWEQSAASVHAGNPGVGEQLQRLIDRAVSDSRVVWRSVGDVVSESQCVA
jgi:hypothetical protein